MNTLRPDLDSIDFDKLVELGRSLLPKYAPAWTDHNLHDPGITLIELLSWVADAQIYALARMRSDERWAYGALAGVRPRGPIPARGFVWPRAIANSAAADSPFGPGVLLEAQAPVKAERAQMPAFRIRDAVNLTGARLSRMESVLANGVRVDRTRVNEAGQAGFYPFGETPARGDRLVLSFTGPLLAPDVPGTPPRRARDACLALGVNVPVPVNAEVSQTPDTDHAPNGRHRHGDLDVRLAVGPARYELPVRLDGTEGFLRSGVILLGLAQVPAALPDEFVIEMTSRGHGFAGAPRIRQIVLNALPIEQLRTVEDTLAAWSNGLPTQTYELSSGGVCYSAARPAPRVSLVTAGRAARWHAVNDLSEAGPADAVFSFDPQGARVTFGNGVNGRIPAPGATLRVVYDVCDGAAGNLGAGLGWHVTGAPVQNGTSVYGSNPAPIAGGADALDLDTLRRLARRSVRDAHPIVTTDDLEQAVLALEDLRVARAQELRPSAAASAGVPRSEVRTLVAVRARAAGDDPALASESEGWLDAIRRRLVGRMPLGERLRIVAPDYRTLHIQASMRARPGYSTERLAALALDLLTAWLAPVAGTSGRFDPWPLGRAVEVLDVRARLLRIDGVASVVSCALLWDGDATQPVPPASRAFLPLFSAASSVVTVEASAPGARR
ncbi:putative baseplate assembly protein [Caballeronia ptereochthonis]|uniref:Baseplate J-like protein n=1 Tax=Caballeronia ptereochthonis TaxID=1777144 RepID=A0A158DYN9_9BURK|nr:putative baseplate assembly protein [Caballeronia ptereochthonis]SAK99732.1 hypothetical protein AWB83_06134 [Caballeronia ptereochthonis]